MRRREFTAKKQAILLAAAILCLTGVHAEAAEIRDGDTGYVASNSIWFTDESGLSVWKRVRQAFAPNDVKTYQQLFSKSGKHGSSPDQSRSRLLATGPTSTRSRLVF